MTIILDGGMGRELKRIGAPFRQPEWSALALIEAPERVADVHRAFAVAGARVITTNSYAVVPFHIGADRFAAEGETRAARAGALARGVAEAPDFAGLRVAGSLPPTCGSYRPDLFDAAVARATLAPLVRGLAPHIDLWLAETLSTTAEVAVAAEVLGDDPRPRWFSFTLRDEDVAPGDAPRLRSGEPVAAGVAAALAAGASAVLFNCSQPEVMEAAVRVARAEATARAAVLEIGVYANAFPPQQAEATANETLLPLRPDLDPPGYLGWARRWQAAGAGIIGGCCGIGPEHIAVLAADLA